MLLEGQWAHGSSNGNIVIHLGMRNDIAHDLPSLLPLGIDLLGCFFLPIDLWDDGNMLIPC